jgi:hypothetical protein
MCVDVVSGSSEARARAHLPSELKATLPLLVFAPLYLRARLGLLVFLKRKFNVEMQPVPNTLPDTNPLIRAATLATWEPAASTNVCSRAARAGAPSRGFK